MSEYLFTYGTLMKGFDNPFARILQDASEYDGNGHFPGLLYLVSWYPGAVYLKENPSKVYGEIYRLSEQKELLKQLDEYEDVFENEKDSLYLRKVIPVTRTNGGIIHCWAYLYNQQVHDLPVIPEGDFRKFSL
ncbi:gamma-glutamylcyclotransferase [Dyadobacter flavalbus]|uniref:Gamma-glutamylcyclotransferase family protein n=1 Tax=Dyadobacter flavalbus TaxID=2579942 RepID=A0A5M8QZY5_9BACT|nr:gamma-glutamylcyclotransferase family protein [Dyadobacter flavalbus]KAA6440304.1 gamma-glutamylcyclotransferase [Dyadobacter flavalbus]